MAQLLLTARPRGTQRDHLPTTAQSESLHAWETCEPKGSRSCLRVGRPPPHQAGELCLVKDAVTTERGAGRRRAGAQAHRGMAGRRQPFSSMKWPPALSTQQWCRDMSACRAVVGLSLPF